MKRVVVIGGGVAGLTTALHLKDGSSQLPGGLEVVVLDKSGNEIAKETASKTGLATFRLAQYKAKGAGRHKVNGKLQVKIDKTDVSEYVVQAGAKKAEVVMDQDREIAL